MKAAKISTALIMGLFSLFMFASLVNAAGLNWYTPSGKNFFIKTCSDSRTDADDGIDLTCTDAQYRCLEQGDYWVEFDLSEEVSYAKDCRTYPDPHNCNIIEDGYGKLIVKAWNINWDSNQRDCECYVGAGKWDLGGDYYLQKCCGDDSNEYKRTKECVGGACSSDATDDACCNFDKDCVYNSVCYSANALLDLEDASTDLEICMDNGWQDPDNSQEACERVNNKPRPTKWVVNGVCGMRKTGEGDCNDAIPSTADFCCGDDGSEIVREGFDNVCFAKENDCYSYLDKRYYVEGTYFENNYCEKGMITTITKLVALQLLDIAEKTSPFDYSLFCDDYEKTLNYYSYQVFGVPVVQYLSEVNDICVLNLPNQVIFGAALNKPINEGRFIDVLSGVNNCNDAINKNDGNFHQCNSGSSKAWYNAGTQSVIYSNNNIYNLPSDFELNTWEAFLTFLRNPFQSIFNFLFNLFKQKSIVVGDYDFINYTKDFSRIYLNRKDIQSIQGITEKIKEPERGEYISVTYSGYNNDICSTVNLVYDKFKRKGQLGRKDLVLCHYDPATGDYYVASNSSMALALWPELTAILRPRGVCPNIIAPTKAIVDYPIEFYANTAWCDETPVAYEWDFGDGTTATGKNPTKTYVSQGERTVTLTVTNRNEEIKKATARINVALSGDCELKTDCGEDLCVLSLSDTTDAHASKQCGDFGYNLCCPNIFEMDSGCDEAHVLLLSDKTDAHAEAYSSQGLFDNKVCVQSAITGKTASCRYISSGDCGSGEVCFASLSDTTDAHVSSCEDTQFGVKVCCKIQ